MWSVTLVTTYHQCSGRPPSSPSKRGASIGPVPVEQPLLKGTMAKNGGAREMDHRGVSVP